MMRPNAVSAFLVIGLILGTVSRCDAEVFDLLALMDGQQADAGAGTGSLGTGTGIVTYDDSNMQLDWNVSWSGLTGTPTLMHFHGPANPDQNAGVQVGIGVATNPVIGSAMITAAQASDLLNGLWYLNLHTTEVSGGEIRGQVLLIPEPATLSLIAVALFATVASRSRPTK